MKIIIAGGRDFTDYDFMLASLNNLFGESEGITIISGTARGADQLGERWARAHKHELVRMPADWAKYGRSAGYKRNDEMAKLGNVLVAFWDGKSRGTMHMINLARKQGLTVHVFNYGV